jgi:hypothetical protein
LGERGSYSWFVPLGANGEKLEFIRDWAHLPEARAGAHEAYPTVEFSQKVKNAEIFLSGFGLRQTRGGDSEVAQIRVDAWIHSLFSGNAEFLSAEERRRAERTVTIKLLYILVDEDPSGHEDFNEGAIGFTVVAHTEPQN